MNAISALPRAAQHQAASPALAFCAAIAATFAGMAITAPTAPTNSGLVIWTLAGANAGLIASITLLHNALTQGREQLITLSGATLILAGGALGHSAATLSAN